MGMYKKLPTSRSTRILTFTSTPPYARDEAIYCEWSITSVDHPEPYYALSYVWGDASTKGYDLVCNGHLVKITYNLWVALKAIRSKAPAIRLWVDAICINQEDTSEKNQQVAMMGSIYSRAQCVVVWVGEETEHTGDFFRALDIVKATGQLTPENCPRPKQRVTGRRRADEMMLVSHILDCGDDIAMRPWFERVWTFQEIRLATQAVIHCGSHIASFSAFLQTVHQINALSTAHDLCGARLVNVQMFAPDHSFASLYRVLALTQKRKATDPRDKVYSILSMLPPDLYSFMKPDYALSTQQVFAYASRVCLEIDDETNILMGAGLDSNLIETPQEYRRRGERDPDLLSWAVDWGIFNSQVYSNQNLSRSLKITNSKTLRARNRRGNQLDPTSMEIRLRGVAAGRFVVDKQKSSLTLTEFPVCAIQSYSGMNSQSCILFTERDFRTFWRSLQLHDTDRCTCSAARSDRFYSSAGRQRGRGPASPHGRIGMNCIVYKLRGVPASIQSGDWLWTPRIPDDTKSTRNERPRSHIRVRKSDDPLAAAEGYAMYDSSKYELVDDEDDNEDGDKEDEIPWVHYVLRPVHGTGEPCFQLVGRSHGLRMFDDDEGIVFGGDRARYTDPLVKIQATFTLV